MGNISYNCFGKGKTHLVLLHGFLEHSAMWKNIVPKFSKTHAIIAIDLPGHGKTSTFKDIHTMHFMAKMVSKVLEAENVKKAHVVGHSMGGYVALAFGKTFSEKITDITLLNSTAMADSKSKKADRLRAVEVLKKSPKRFIKEAIPNLFAEQNRTVLHKEIEQATNEALQTDGKGAIACTLGMRNRPSSVNWIKKSNIPVNFIAGADDPIIPIEKVKHQAERTKSRLFTIQNCGHMAHLEQKGICLDYLKEVLI